MIGWPQRSGTKTGLARHASRTFVLAGAVGWGAFAPAAIAQISPAPQNVVQLTAQGEVDITQDVLQITLSLTRQGAQSAEVQSQLRSALNAALAKAQPAAEKGRMDVHTGNFGLYPHYDKDGRIGNWQGTAELVLEGKDFDRITRTAGAIDSLTVSSVSFGLSSERRMAVEGEAQSSAIAMFRAKASRLAQDFGFKSYTLREVSVNESDNGSLPRPRMMAMAARASDSASSPIPVEPGQSRVTVTVSGSVQMQ